MASLRFVFSEKILVDKLRVDLMVPGGIVRTDAQHRAAKVRDRARQLLRERSANPTGKIESTIRYVTEQIGPDRVVAQVGSDDPAAGYVERGTGIYGSHHQRITVRSRGSMFFVSRQFGDVFADSVKGQPGKHFLRDALDSTTL